MCPNEDRSPETISSIYLPTALRSKFWTLPHKFLPLNLKLFSTTDTELKAMAAPAIIGSSKKPVKGYRIPAAMGIPMRL